MIKVHFFAGLKRYFPAPVMLNSEELNSLQDVLDTLKKKDPDATELLEKCRVAVNENFVPLDTTTKNVTEVFVIPPSSGG